MTLRHLLIFIEVANCGKMSQAANKLFISQPTVSQVISELEAHYEVKLFERFPKTLCITEDGKILLNHAKKVINYYNVLEETMKNPNHNLPLQIGATVTIGNRLISLILSKFKEKHEDEKIRVYVNNTREIEKRLLSNELDVGIVEGIIKSPHLLVTPIKEDKLVLVCSSEHPLASKEIVSMKDIVKENFIMREEGSGTRDIFTNFVQAQGYSINIDWEASEPGAIIQGVLNNHGITVISECLVENEIKDGKLKKLELKGFKWKRTFNLVYHKNKVLSPAVKDFLEESKKFCENM
ncbi:MULTISPECIES: LysR family transcriptional regulator [unclassified Fusobacterium]|uniref:LysR family transcriptional regulator n=1 Tax=unclassified Fusobacterium TaxID=2648384 RepID=UPI00261504D8|nr:LysR family transcriptional regulator [Fusobacterium sp.]